MMNLLSITLAISLLFISYTYLIYPWIISLLAKGKQLPDKRYTLEDLPNIAVVFAAYNEEKVIVKKLKNFDAIDYPSEKLAIHLGLDHPDDCTAQLIQENLPSRFPLQLHHFMKRGGKANVLNKIFNEKIELADYDVIIMMDANIILKDDCLVELVKYFKDPQIGLVGAVIKNTIDGAGEIAQQEQFYISKESEIKVNEGLAFGATIGAFGACYAIRSAYIKNIPSNFLMEDFYLSLHVFEHGARCITNPLAVVFEDLPGGIDQEFKRKRRISTGNFQNLKAYMHLLWSNTWPVGFAFFSHKVLRWFTPFLLFASILASALLFVLYPSIQIYQMVFALMIVNIFLPLIDLVLKAMNISLNLLRLHRYFLSMNIAMFLGFIDWVRGVKTNIWKPTERL